MKSVVSDISVDDDVHLPVVLVQEPGQPGAHPGPLEGVAQGGGRPIK